MAMFIERGTVVNVPTALKKLSKAWKMYKWDAKQGVQENGVQVTIPHEDWAVILKALHLGLKGK